MFSKKHLGLVMLLAAGASGVKGATIGYLSNLVGPSDTEVNYTLTMQKFDPSLGTLTGVKIYFYAEEDVSHLTLTNTSLTTTQQYGAAATVNLVSGMTNSATAADKFSGASETLTFFDTGISTALGNCSDNGAAAIRPNQCSQLTYSPGETHDFGPFTFANTDSLYLNDPNHTLTSGTGVQNLTGVVRNGTTISNYLGTGTFTLSGATVNSLTLQNGGGNINFTQITQAKFQAEVDYTYTPAGPTPEPATMGLMGSALVGLVALARRFRA